MMEGLGRRYAPDERDKAYPMASALPRRAHKRSHRHWNSNRWWGDQGGTSMCVPYSWAHCIERPNIPKTPWHSFGAHMYFGQGWEFIGQHPLFNLESAYSWAQENDEWEGTDYDGTSVRAGAKYLHRLGLIGGYTWAYDVATVAQAVTSVGPVVVGTIWTMDMFIPDKDGFITPTGEVVGGHAYAIDGVSNKNRWFRIKQTYGPAWGKGGFARISFNDLALLLDTQGEACLPIFK